MDLAPQRVSGWWNGMGGMCEVRLSAPAGKAQYPSAQVCVTDIVSFGVEQRENVSFAVLSQMRRFFMIPCP